MGIFHFPNIMMNTVRNHIILVHFYINSLYTLSSFFPNNIFLEKKINYVRDYFLRLYEFPSVTVQVAIIEHIIRYLYGTISTIRPLQ